MIKVGELKVISSNFVLVPIGKTVCFDLNEIGVMLEVVVKFQSSTLEQGIKIEPVGNGKVELIFNNWDNPLGSTLKTPVQLATFVKGTLFFMAANSRSGETNILQLQFMWKDVP